MTTTQLHGEIPVTGWDEQPYAERGGERKLTRAVISQDVTGAVTGRGEAQLLMSYAPDGTARYVGLQLLEGEIDGRRGSAVLESVGTFDGTQAAGTWTVVPGSAEGEWAAIEGSGTFTAPLGGTPTYSLDCTM